MRTILIVFAILLLLLTLLGAFGGSVKYNESFDDMKMDEPENPLPDNYENMPPNMEDFTDDTDQDPYDMSKSQFYEPPSIVPPPPSSTFDKENFANPAANGATSVTGVLPGMSKFTNGTVDSEHTAPLVSNFTSEGMPGVEEFYIEPFEQDSHSSIPAAF